MRYNKNGDLSERSIHLSVMQWISYHPYIKKYVLHFPNESKRTPRYGKLLKDMGMRKGVADLLIAMSRHGYCGAWIELKTESGRPTKEQTAFLQDMKNEGYFTKVTYGYEQAYETIEWYCLK